jgi:hypothetical protein
MPLLASWMIMTAGWRWFGLGAFSSDLPWLLLSRGGRFSVLVVWEEDVAGVTRSDGLV